MFYGYKSLSDIKPLQNWNVSNGNNFSYMFYGYKSLSDIKPYKIGMFQMEIILDVCSVVVNHYQI